MIIKIIQMNAIRNSIVIMKTRTFVILPEALTAIMSGCSLGVPQEYIIDIPAGTTEPWKQNMDLCSIFCFMPKLNHLSAGAASPDRSRGEWPYNVTKDDDEEGYIGVWASIAKRRLKRRLPLLAQTALFRANLLHVTRYCMLRCSQTAVEWHSFGLSSLETEVNYHKFILQNL
jgi:hypothetical protein